MKKETHYTVDLRKKATLSPAPVAHPAHRLSNIPPHVRTHGREAPTEAKQERSIEVPRRERRSVAHTAKPAGVALRHVLYHRHSPFITSVVSLLLALISSGAIIHALFFDKPQIANAATEMTVQYPE